MADETELFIVGGIGFNDAEEAKAAQAELGRIKAIDAKLDLQKPETVAAVYEKARVNYVFQTPIGIYYMMKLQEYLVKHHHDGIENMPILLSPGENGDTGAAKGTKRNAVSDEVWKARLDLAREQTELAEGRFRFSVLLSCLLAVLVIALFVISQTGRNPTILNYKTKLINEYSAWEKQLDEREALIREKEAQLGISYEADN